MLTGPICEALEKATNPNVKAGIDQWIYCILCHCPRSATPMGFIKSVGPYLVKVKFSLVLLHLAYLAVENIFPFAFFDI